MNGRVLICNQCDNRTLEMTRLGTQCTAEMIFQVVCNKCRKFFPSTEKTKLGRGSKCPNCEKGTLGIPKKITYRHCQGVFQNVQLVTSALSLVTVERGRDGVFENRGSRDFRLLCLLGYPGHDDSSLRGYRHVEKKLKKQPAAQAVPLFFNKKKKRKKMKKIEKILWIGIFVFLFICLLLACIGLVPELASLP